MNQPHPNPKISSPIPVECYAPWPTRATKQTVTYRSARLRAAKCKPPGNNCYWCGRPNSGTARYAAKPWRPKDRPPRHKLWAAHIDGNELNVKPNNIGLTCARCNSQVSATLRKHGIGSTVPTDRNPKKKSSAPADKGAQSMGQWVMAVTAMKGENDQMSPKDAIAMIHATPAARRSRFAREIWDRRIRQGTAGRRYKEEAPF